MADCELRTTEHGLRILHDVRVAIHCVYAQVFPQHEQYGLQSQLRIAAVSIALNIAEGSVYTDKNKQRFYQIALGSTVETIECLSIARSLRFIDKHEQLDDLLDKIRRTLIKLQRRECTRDPHSALRDTHNHAKPKKDD